MNDPQTLINRLQKNQRHLQKWAKREGTNAYRLYDRDIPEFPFAIDRYGDALHVQVYERKRPLGDDELAAVADALSTAFSLESQQLAFKTRRRQRGLAQYERLRAQAPSFLVTEHKLQFEVNLHRYLDTGLFLDHRTTRALVRERSADRTFLNLFAYTGSFSVHAAAGGARRTVTVDMSNTYQAWAGRNLKNNGFGDDSRHSLVQSDVVPFLARMKYARVQFDLIVLDPPSFSNSKRMQDSFDVQRDHEDLIRQTLAVLAPGGELFFSTNRKGFKLAVGLADTVEILDITGRTVPEDFRRHLPHQCWILKH